MDLKNNYIEETKLLKHLTTNLIINAENDRLLLINLKDLSEILAGLPKDIVKIHSKNILGAFFIHLNPNKSSTVKPVLRENLIFNLDVLLQKSEVDNVNVYKNIAGTLLFEIYDPGKDNTLKDCPEEYKLIVVNCIASLHGSIIDEVVRNVYSSETFLMVFANMVYVCLKMAQLEKLKSLRIAAIKCIMSIAKITHNDPTILKISADLFMKFFPLITKVLSDITLEEQKSGHKVICAAINCLGNFFCLLMQNNSSSRDINWFINTDNQLVKVFNKILKICYHDDERIRLEFGLTCHKIVTKCYSSIPITSTKIFEALIKLSEDSNQDVSNISRKALDFLLILKTSDQDFYEKLFDHLEENLFETMNEIPSIFHSVDDDKKLCQLNLLCGYLKLFKNHKLSILLYDPINLKQFMISLLTICTLDKLNLRLFDEYTIQDFEIQGFNKTPWKTFKYHTNENVATKLNELFQLLSNEEIVQDIYYYLIEVFEKETEFKKESTLILNEIISNIPKNLNDDLKIDLILIYLQDENLNLPIIPSESIHLNETHENTIQICLQLEGVGKICLNLNENRCRKLLLKILYPIIEKSGSLNPLIRLSGLKCLLNVSKSSGFISITDLINQNSDYFSYHVTRKLKHFQTNKTVLDVFGVVIKHCSVEVLDSISDIIENISEQTDFINTEEQIPFLRIYDVFLKCLIRWFDVKIILEKVKSKKEKIEEILKGKEELIEENNDFSDQKMKKSVEEMWKEDQNNKIDDEVIGGEECKVKIVLPVHIKLTIKILKTSLNYLSSPNDDIKILSLEILKNGLEIVKDYENELLPLVHKIWTPLKYRFKETVKPLIFNLSFQLLVVMARLSRDFIRQRTSVDVLENILNRLTVLSKQSYLKDRGSEYRTTQAYKLQIVILENLSQLICDIEIATEDCLKLFETVKLYLSNKQPVLLQNLTVQFFKTMLIYDFECTKNYLDSLNKNGEYKKSIVEVFNQ
ncbi:TELO2-interacting protein 1 homolog [Onthophagus taurus]|uniref:TELO2-interacting protein 1 homolog n=1 Tax=Onthophagus taurus TaxID=166361 RepID=UPI0039BE06E1